MPSGLTDVGRTVPVDSRLPSPEANENYVNLVDRQAGLSDF
jgi:hypothetical protein